MMFVNEKLQEAGVSQQFRKFESPRSLTQIGWSLGQAGRAAHL
jgi:hypothetical protein